ncbi:Altered inheritance of mitochondria protein 24 like [Verticillium longisporum]|nr:Altered inheritance of mitochondria protein 24 like [Verticillium longisporum]
MRRTIWGDRLYLQFRGPTTLLMSSRGVRVADVLTNQEVNEISDAQAGVVPKAIELSSQPKAVEPASTEQAPSAIHIASVAKDGKVSFEDAKDLKEFVR